MKVTFKAAYAPFLNNLSQSVISPVSPTAAKAAGPDGFGQKPVGTGPFMFKEWKQKISMTLVKNSDYNWPLGIYKHKGPAYLDQITLKFISEPTVLREPSKRRIGRHLWCVTPGRQTTESGPEISALYSLGSGITTDSADERRQVADR